MVYINAGSNTEAVLPFGDLVDFTPGKYSKFLLANLHWAQLPVRG
jgi:hypothetical protein